MNLIKDKLEKIEKEFTEQVKTAFGSNLHSAYIYGSILTDSFNPATSDVNVLVIPYDANPDRIIVLGKYSAKLIRLLNINPTIMSYDEFLASADIFPMEYYDIKDFHKTLTGEDITEKLVISDRNLRLQVEDRLRGCISSLRQVLILSESNPRLIANGIRNTHSFYNAVFRGILRLKKHPDISYDYLKNLNAVAGYIDFNPKPFKDVMRIFKETPVEELTIDLVTQLSVIAANIDKMVVSE